MPPYSPSTGNRARYKQGVWKRGGWVYTPALAKMHNVKPVLFNEAEPEAKIQHRIALSTENPFYFCVDGVPVFLIGATHQGGWTAVGDTTQRLWRRPR